MHIGLKALIAALAVIVVDLGTKAAAVWIAGDADIGLITPRSNPEFALGIVPLDAHWSIISLLLVCSCFVGIHTVRMVRQGVLSPINGVMILAGAIANGIDRLVTGVVHDFIDLTVAIANVADFAILWGIVVYLIVAWRTVGQSTPPESPVDGFQSKLAQAQK